MPREKTPADESGESTFDDDAMQSALNDAVDEVTFTEEIDDGEDKSGATPDESDNGDGTGEGDESEVSDDSKSGGAAEGDEKDPSERSEEDEDGAADAGEDDSAESGDDAEKDGDEKGDDEGEGDAAAAKPDHLNDPIPEGTHERTRTRIQSLIADVKELSTARDERDEIIHAIERTRATPEQYAGALTVLKLYNSETADDKRKALEIVRGMERDLALELGEGQNHVNLSDYPDLSGEVEAGTLSEERALEIAAIRARDAHVNQKTQQRKEKETSAQQTERQVAQGRADLNALGQELSTDPHYAPLYPRFTALLQTTLRHVHPTEWAETARELFKQLKAAAPAPTTPQPQPTKTGKAANQPLRPKGSSSSNKATDADSALAAMEGALEGM